MDLLRRTAAPAALFHTGVSEDRLLASVVVRSVFRITPGGLVPDTDAPWPVPTGEPLLGEYGDFDGETPFVREGCDLLVLGRAHAPEGGAAAVIVEARVGAAAFAVRVTGDRVWERRGGALVPSAPAPFRDLPLTWSRAFGGTATVEGLPYPWPANPEGRGFYWTEEEALGQPLPNVEDPADPVRAWDHRPDPVGLAPYPRSGALRVLAGVELDEGGPVPGVRKVKPSLYNQAIPRHVLPAAPAAGEAVTVTSVRPGGRPLSFRLPAIDRHVHVQLGDRHHVFPARLELIAVLAEEERVLLGQRCCFRYRMVPRERRAAVLYDGPCPAAAPAHYALDWAAVDAELGHA